MCMNLSELHLGFRLPITEITGTECAEKYSQAEAQELGAVHNDQLVCKPGTSLCQHESNYQTSEQITNQKCVDMPVARQREEIMSLIESNSVVIIQGATGSGKSTQIPQYILDYCIQQSVYCNIAVTQPQRIGASSLARWICRERSWTLGGFVGYQVHERTKEMDLLLLVVRKLLGTNSQSVKVILMSASVSCKEFADYFALPVGNGLRPACVFKVEGRPYAVEEYYLDDLKDTVRFQLPSQNIEEPEIRMEMFEAAVSLIQSFDELEMKSNRVFMEFCRHPTEGFKILPAVYLSLKISQLKIPVELNVHLPRDIEKQLQGLRAARMECPRVHVDCEKQTVKPVEVSFGTLHWSEMIPDRVLAIKITEVIEVGHFWGQRTDEKYNTLLQALNDEINNQKLIDLQVTPCPWLVCLAPFPQLGNGEYYRARILHVCEDAAEVFYVDYGNRSKVPLKTLKEIPNSVRELPFLASEFKICKMRPSAKSLVYGERWSYSASERFASLIHGCTHLVKVYSFVRNVLHVDVLCCSAWEPSVNIRDVLVEEGYAELVEESYESQQSHDLLESLFLGQVNKEEKMPVSSREEKHLIERLLNLFPDNKPGTAICKVTLSAPLSPYQVKCYSMTRVSAVRDVVIQKESINSVAIHCASEGSFQQLLVAASLSAVPTVVGSAVNIGETSLMPPIPGLLAFLSMLFAPAVELRVDRSRKCFTGALCGLGWSQTHGAPLFPENDMELVFDVHFGLEDIREINVLRLTINKLLHECEVCSGQENMRQLQENIRQKLLCSICKSKPRDKIVPTGYEKPYAWNQVDSRDIIDPPEGNCGRENDLYQLHKLVLLDV